MKDNLIIFLYKIIPKGVISRIFGFIMRIRLPGFILNPAIEWYCKKFPVKKDEILQPEGGFKTFEEFFTRNVKKGTHIVDIDKNAIVSPVDAKISCFGNIDENRIFQAKGLDYNLHDFVPSDMSREFLDGSYITLYLSPADYHHIHSPVEGHVAGYFAVPGKLFTVQEFMVNSLPGLFSKNERIIKYIKNDHGLTAVCMIGALNVGRISISHGDIVTNKTFRKRYEFMYPEDQKPFVEKAARIGTFHLGSTVIMLFQKDMINFDNIELNSQIRLGSRIGGYK